MDMKITNVLLALCWTAQAITGPKKELKISAPADRTSAQSPEGTTPAPTSAPALFHLSSSPHYLDLSELEEQMDRLTVDRSENSKRIRQKRCALRAVTSNDSESDNEPSCQERPKRDRMELADSSEVTPDRKRTRSVPDLALPARMLAAQRLSALAQRSPTDIPTTTPTSDATSTTRCFSAEPEPQQK